MFEDRLLRRTLVQETGSKTCMETFIQYNDENNIYPSPDIMTALASRNLRSLGHVACVRLFMKLLRNVRGEA